MNTVQTIPSRLYKYESLTTQALQNLKKQVLYFGPPSKFNDPYDCAVFPTVLPPTPEEVEKFRQAARTKSTYDDIQALWDKRTTNEELRSFAAGIAKEALKRHLEAFTTEIGITCFSEVNSDLLMWSHYGGRYKGFCLEFDSSLEPFRRARPVKYVDEYPTISFASITSGEDPSPVEELFRTKSRSWEYEREWRAMHQTAGTEYTYPAEALTGIYFGPDIDFASIEIVCLVLQGQNPSTRFYKGTRSPHSFRVDFEEFSYSSYIENLKRKSKT